MNYFKIISERERELYYIVLWFVLVLFINRKEFFLFWYIKSIYDVYVYIFILIDWLDIIKYKGDFIFDIRKGSVFFCI